MFSVGSGPEKPGPGGVRGNSVAQGRGLRRPRTSLMNGTYLLAIALGVGIVAGLRSFTAPAILAWGAHLGWLNLQDSRLAFMGSSGALAIFSLVALGELIADKVPGVPRRTAL